MDKNSASWWWLNSPYSESLFAKYHIPIFDSLIIYVCIIHNIKTDKYNAIIIDSNKPDYWDALRKGLYYCSKTQDTVLTSVYSVPKLKPCFAI